MAVLTIVYAGNQVFNAEVESFGFETSARGDLFVTASTEPVDLGIDGQTGDAMDDDRLTPFEKSLLLRRESDG